MAKLILFYKFSIVLKRIKYEKKRINNKFDNK